MKRAASIALLVLVVAAIHITPAEAARDIPATRQSNQPHASGANTSSAFTIPTSTDALIHLCYYNDTGPEATVRPTSVSLNGTAATLITSAGATSSLFSALYKASGYATGASKTLSYTLSGTGTYTVVEVSIEYRDGSPTIGTTGAGSAASDVQNSPGPASTSGINNSAGSEIVAAYCSKDNFGSPPTMGTGQSKLDETDDMTGLVYYGFTTEAGTGSADVQTVGAGGTANLPVISAVSLNPSGNQGQLASGPFKRLLKGKL